MLWVNYVSLKLQNDPQDSLIFCNYRKGVMQEEEEMGTGQAGVLRPISLLRSLIIRVHLLPSNPWM